jgi:hypothetical protein
MGGFIEGSYQLRPCQSGYHNRIKICFYWIAQVSNLPHDSFFLISKCALKMHSWMSSLELHINLVLAKVVTTTESKSVSLGLRGFETCGTTIFLSEHAFKTHSWMVSLEAHHNFILDEVVPTRESKSIAQV